MKDYVPPKYIIVKRAIQAMLDQEELKPNALLPSERELMETYNVSRITIRRAIDELEKEGCLYKVQGKGTFVKGDGQSQDLISITSCTEDVIRLGMVPTRKVLGSEVIDADRKRQSRLNLSENDKVFCLKRVYYADGDPLNYTIVYLPYKFFPKIETYDFEANSLYATLEEVYGVKITRAERTLEAVIAHDDVCEYLDLDVDVPLILFQCVTYGEINGIEYPIETFKCYYRSDRFKFCVNQVRR